MPESDRIADTAAMSDDTKVRRNCVAVAGFVRGTLVILHREEYALSMGMWSWLASAQVHTLFLCICMFSVARLISWTTSIPHSPGDLETLVDLRKRLQLIVMAYTSGLSRPFHGCKLPEACLRKAQKAFEIAR